MTIKVGVVGATGRTGSQVLLAIQDFPQFSAEAGLVSPGSRSLGVEAYGVTYTDRLEALSTCSVVIEFASADRTADVALFCSERKIPLLIGTTGHSTEQRASIAGTSSGIPVLWAPNTSLGVFALRAASRVVQEILGADFDARVLDIHHSRKKDAPSGTAKQILATVGLESSVSEGPQSPVAALRGGDEPGHHTVYFLGRGERLELTHIVHDRLTFGRGALRLAERLILMAPGAYTVDDLYSRK